MKRVEDPRLLTGHGQYVDDIRIGGLLHAAFVRSNVARGDITRIDTSAALSLDGVVAVYTAADVNHLAQAMWVSHFGPPSETVSYPPLHPLADDDVRFVGDPIAVVVAVDRYVAEDAADLVEVDIDVLPAVSGFDRARDPDAPRVHKERSSNVSGNLSAASDLELDELLAHAPHVITRTFRQARATNVPMEPRGLICDYDPFSGEYELIVSSQSPHEYRAFCSRLLDIPESKVRVRQRDVGGGFGQKMYVTRDEAAMMIAGYLLQRPVKWIEDRRENLMTANQCREQEATVTSAVDLDGTILGVSVHQVEDVGAFPTFGVGSAAAFSAMVVTGPYKILRARYTCESLFSNTVPKAPYRGPWMMETTVREQLVDHIARELNLDPLDVRRRNVITQSDLPFTMPSRLLIDQLTASETLEQAAQIVGYERFRAEQAAARAAGRYLGLGMSLFVEPSAVGLGMNASEGATVRVTVNGDVDVFLGSGNHGQSIETTIAQVVADRLGCRFESVTIRQGDTQGTPHSTGTGGSRTAVFCGGAAAKAAHQIQDKVIEIAAGLLEAAPEDLRISDSVISVTGTPARAISLADVALAAYRTPAALPDGMDAGLEATVRFATDTTVPFTWSNACHICVVEVDIETGTTEILRYVVSEDCGTMINPMVVEGQISGGVVQGIGGALYEHLVYDDDGNPLATTFLDYLVPTATEVPPIEIGHVETAAPDNPGGFKGLGEGGAIASPAAVANAVADALAPFGVIPTRFPMGPSQLLGLLQQPPAAT